MNGLLDWLNQELRKRGLKGHVYQNAIKQEGHWYYVPVYIDMRDAYDKATLMQGIEDAWEKENIQPGTNLLLVPAAPHVAEAAV